MRPILGLKTRPVTGATTGTQRGKCPSTKEDFIYGS